MLDKKGDFGFPFYFFPAVSLLMFLLVLYGVIFFVIEIGQSPNLVIKSESYQDSSKIITILRSPTSVQQNNINLTIAELISLANQDESYKEKLTEELNFLVNRLPKVPKGENLADVVIATPSATRETIKEAYWNLDVEVEDISFLHIGESVSFSDIYLEQSMNVPLRNKKLAKVKLYLNCLACKEEDIVFIA